MPTPTGVGILPVSLDEQTHDEAVQVVREVARWLHQEIGWELSEEKPQEMPRDTLNVGDHNRDHKEDGNTTSHKLGVHSDSTSLKGTVHARCLHQDRCTRHDS